MIEYVSIISFYVPTDDIVLLKKLKGPTELIGKITFPGGKIEQGESLYQAAAREWKEETGVDRPIGEFFCVSTKEGEDFRVHFMANLSQEACLNAKPQPTELEKVYLGSLNYWLNGNEPMFMKDSVEATRTLMKAIGYV